MDRGRFYSLSYDYMCVLYKRHTLHLLNYYWSEFLVYYNESLFLSCVFILLIVNFGVSG